MICSTAPMILRPPEAPSAKRRPSPPSPMTGQKLPRQRLPGPSELGLPGSGSNHMMPLFSSRPVDGDTTREPKIDSSVCVTEHMLPWRSTTLKCVVQDGALRGLGEAGGVAHAGEPRVEGLVERARIGHVAGGTGRAARGRQLGFEDAERLRQRRPAGQARRDVDASVAIRHGLRIDDARLVAGEIGLGHAAALGAQVAHQRARHLAFVEFARAVARQLLQRGRHGALVEVAVADRGPAAADRPGAVVEEHARGVGIGRKLARHRRREQRGEPVDQQAFLRQRHGGREQVAPGHAAVFRVGEAHAGDHARHRDGGGAFARCGRPAPRARRRDPWSAPPPVSG